MFRLRVFSHGLALAGSLLILSACAAPSASVPLAGTNPKLKVVATTSQVAALTKVVGGDLIELTGLVKAGTDPHAYEPTPEDLRALANAQLIIENGVGLEGWLDKVVKNAGAKASIVDASKGVKLRKGDEQEPQGDPHIWFFVPNAVVMLNNIRDGMVAVDAAHADAYKANAAAYENKLNDLDQYIRQQIASIPAANRKLVTNHDVFGYYSDGYGLTFVGSVVPSMDTGYEPSAKELAGLVEAIKAQQVKAIFAESSMNPGMAKKIAQEAGIRVVDGALFGDTLGPPGSGADTLDGMLKLNTDIIVSNLK